MNENLLENTRECYRLAEQKATNYLHSLEKKVKEQTYVSALTKDIQLWEPNHVYQRSLLSLFSRKQNHDTKSYYQHIRWLDRAGKLDDYLDRSISYIFMRDLGKSLDSFNTQSRIQRVVNGLKKQLTKSQDEAFSITKLYRWAQKEGIESTFIWVMEKCKTVSSNIPERMDAEQAERKLIKMIAGVLMHALEEMQNQEVSSEERIQKLNEAIRIGYYYGLTYPFIDDLLDAKILSPEEQDTYVHLIRTTLVTGNVPELGEWSGENASFIQYVHSELREAFQYIKAHQQSDTKKYFFEQSYVFFHAQEVDRSKELSNAHYTNEELYVPVILKSASSRLMARCVINAHEDEDVDSRLFYYGIYNQLADDFTDMFDDLEAGAVTPYTYYLKHHRNRSNLINPFELYWTVIFYVIHDVYHSNPKVSEIILDRAINGLKRYKKRLGSKKYNEVMAIFATGNTSFDQLIQKLVQAADDVDFFDKLLRDHMLNSLRNERKERDEFLHTVEIARNEVNAFLPISKNDHASLLLKESIIDAANYSLEGDGKRLRPIMTWMMAVNGYGLHKSAIVPLLKSLEYMHTASLIFDDLPAQDNASTRRGRTTLHQQYNNAIAELTGLFLTQKAIEEQTLLDQFDAKTVLHLIQYSARIAMDMCRGQAMDLDSKGKQLNLEQLKTMCFYKTGIAFEAALIMPAILAQVKETEMEALKRFALHVGIAFQIKDDLLDVEGDSVILGKTSGIDEENNNATFVSILGQDAARKEMWEQYCLAMEALVEVPCNTGFLKQLANYVVHRDR